MGLALPGQILMSRHVFDDARQYVREHPCSAPDSPALELEWLDHGPFQFKGTEKEDALKIGEAGPVGIAPLRVPPNSEKAWRAVLQGDEIVYGWRPARGKVVPGNEDWRLEERLGEGGFGEVWLVVHPKTHEKRVFKFCFEPDRLRGLRREVVLFRVLREALGEREDLARIIAWHFDRPPFYLEFAYTPAGSFPDWAAGQGGLSQVPLETRLEIIAGTAEALAAAHSVGVLHKDIKLQNILIRVGKDGKPHPLLADFGIGLLTDQQMSGD
jgi:serine/threonine-protein kinase